MDRHIVQFRRRTCLTFLVSVLLIVAAVQNASAGLLGDFASFANSTRKVPEEGYQSATKPIRGASHDVYTGTIRKPFNEVKDEFNKAIPEKIKFACKDNVEWRFRPATDIVTEGRTGEKTFSDATSSLIGDYEDQAIELLVPPDLYTIYQSAKAAADPIPNDLLDIIAPHWGKLTNRTLHRDARYIVSAELVDRLTNGYAAAITLYDIVLFARPLSNAPDSLALLAHEMVHVDQYYDLGLASFAMEYYVGGKFKTGSENPMEAEAYLLERRMLSLLRKEHRERGVTRQEERLSLRQTPNSTLSGAGLQVLHED